MNWPGVLRRSWRGWKRSLVFDTHRHQRQPPGPGVPARFAVATASFPPPVWPSLRPGAERAEGRKPVQSE